GDLDGGRAAVGKEHPRQIGRRDRDELRRQFFRRLMGKSGEDDLVEPLGLRLHGRDDFRVIVPMDIRPPGRNGVDDPLAGFGEQIGAFGAIDEDRVRKDRVLRKWMPNRRRAHAKSSRLKPRANTLSSASRSTRSSRGTRPRIRTPEKSAIVRMLSGLSSPTKMSPCNRMWRLRSASIERSV